MGYPEWSAGLGLGVLPVLGAYFVQTGTYTIGAVLASIPSGILVHNLLLLNEFPDAEYDVTVKRRTLPIFVGKKWAAIILFGTHDNCLSLDNRHRHQPGYADLYITGIINIPTGI